MKNLFTIFFATGLLYCQPSEFRNIDFSKADSIARIYPSEAINNLPSLVYGLTSNLDGDVEKFRAIYMWICSNIKNDYSSFKKTTAKRKKFTGKENRFLEWNKSYLPKVYDRLVNQRKTACTGYAYLLKQMTMLAGLECKIIDGFAKTTNTNLTEDSSPNHSWNVVKLEEHWYLCDATWSAGRVTFKNTGPEFVFDYSNAYFLAAPELFAKNHYPLNHKWLLLEEPFSFKNFLEGPLIYKGAFEHGATPIEPQRMFLKIHPKTPITFKFSVDGINPIDGLELLIVKGDAMTRIQPSRIRTENGLGLLHIFEKKGLYDVHILADEAIIATYVVKVSKDSSYP